MFTIETLRIDGEDKRFLWLRCETCIAGLVTLPMPNENERPAIEAELLLIAQNLGWDLTTLCRCPLCVRDDWHDHI